MGTTSEKLTYLNTTKGKIKDSINLTGANITTEPFRQYSTKLEDAYIDIINNGTDTLYNNFPKVSGEGTSLTLNNTYQAPMRNNLKGNTSQTGTPTPTSPIPVNVVSGDNTITISNQGGTDSNTYNIDLPVENLFDKDNANVLNAYINKKQIISNSNARTLYINAKPSTTYTISREVGNRFGVTTTTSTPADNVIGTNGIENNTASSITITTGENDKYVAVYFYLSSADTNTPQQIMETIQIEEGSKANSYTPFGTTPIELCKIGTYQDQFKKATGKNLAPINLESETYNSLQITNNNNGTFTLLGNPTGSFGRDIATNLTLKAGTYTISANAMPSGLYIALDNEADTQLSNGTLSKTFTLASDTTYTSLGIWFTKNKDYDVTIQLQIEEGSSVTEWQPMNGWYLHKEIGKWVFNGTDMIEVSGLKSIYARNMPPDKIYTSNNGAYFERAKFILSTATKVENSFYENPSNFLVIGSSTDTLETLKTKFDGGLLYYILATPTSEGIPTNLINQLEEFYQAQSKNNQTNISQINNDLGFIISASALKKGV